MAVTDRRLPSRSIKFVFSHEPASTPFSRTVGRAPDRPSRVAQGVRNFSASYGYSALSHNDSGESHHLLAMAGRAGLRGALRCRMAFIHRARGQGCGQAAQGQVANGPVGIDENLSKAGDAESGVSPKSVHLHHVD